MSVAASRPSAPPAERLKADAVLVALTVGWGLTFTAVKGALAFADPVSFLVARFALASTLLAIFLGATGLRELLRRELLRAGLLLGVILAAGFLTQTVGLLYTTPARSAFLTGLCVLLTPLFSAIFLRKLPGAWATFGAALAAVGLYAMTWTRSGGLGETWKGDLLTIVCAVTVAVHVLLTGHYARRLPALPLVLLQQLVAAVLFALWLPFVETRFTPHPALWMGLAVGALVSSLVSYLQFWAQARTSAIRAALIFALEPVFGALFSTWLTGEVLGTRVLFGGGLILTGVVISEVGSYWRALSASRVGGPSVG